MPKVEWTGWIALAIAMYVFAMCVGWEAWRSAKTRGWGKGPRISSFLAATVMVAGALNGLVYGVSTTGGNTPPKITALDVMSEGFGLRSGEKYTLMLGSRIAGSDLEVTGNRNSFNVKETSGSKLSISFTAPDKSHYIVGIPDGPIQFITDEDPAKTSVVLYLENPVSDTVDYGFKELAYESPCTTIVQSGYLACDRVREYKTVISQELKNAGLNTYVAKTFRRAIVTLPCDVFTSIMEEKGVLGAKDCG